MAKGYKKRLKDLEAKVADIVRELESLGKLAKKPKRSKAPTKSKAARQETPQEPSVEAAAPEEPGPDANSGS